MIKSKKLKEFKNIKHGFFNSLGGVSSGQYKSLNCGIGSKDKKINVIKNLEITSKKISIKKNKLVLLRQIHSNKIYFIKKIPKKKLIGDGVITNSKNIAFGILTADCAPILFYDHKKNIIGAIHAGWKGAFKGIIKNVINYMLKKGCKKNNIIAAIGPCIGQANYNVKEDFKRKFIKKNKKNKIFFRVRKNIIYFDLPHYVKSQLKLNKITNIDVKNVDTFVKKNNFFSARQSLRLKHDDYGRNISIIMIN